MLSLINHHTGIFNWSTKTTVYMIICLGRHQKYLIYMQYSIKRMLSANDSETIIIYYTIIGVLILDNYWFKWLVSYWYFTKHISQNTFLYLILFNTVMLPDEISLQSKAAVVLFCSYLLTVSYTETSFSLGQWGWLMATPPPLFICEKRFILILLFLLSRV